MGESVAEATITAWLKDVGDTIEADESILEIATDKVDSEVPSEVDGVLIEKRFDIDAVVQVGQTIAVIEIEGDDEDETSQTQQEHAENVEPQPNVKDQVAAITQTITEAKTTTTPVISSGDRFYSPLVKNIAKAEGITQAELDTITGTGKDGRVTKNDIKNYLKNRSSNTTTNTTEASKTTATVTMTKPVSLSAAEASSKEKPQVKVVASGDEEIIEMTRMGKLISKHMVDSVQTSAHVQSFVEADVTNIWNWRNKHKANFKAQEGENLTFTPIFMEAVAKALRDFPMMNISVNDNTIIKKKHINLGMAAALPDGNLIVPVIKDADQLNLLGMAKKVNDLASRARQGQLKPDEIQDGTYTVTNVGTFGSIMGTPIINQPQVGILALGAIRKVPAVIETPQGDFIGIRHKMFLSHSYDHRVVNGALGGQFVKAVKDYLEAWDINREI